jgi:Xaa-Pro aminopeptidase
MRLTNADQTFPMRYTPLPSSLFSEARKRLRRHLPPGAAAILHANDVYPTNADGSMPFVQSSDLFYLSGVDQEETILMLFPDAPDEKMREMLFLRETNEHIAIWEGAKLTKELAAQRSGIPVTSIFWLGEFERALYSVMGAARTIFLNTNEHYRAASEVETREMRFIRRCQRDFPLHRYERLAPLMHGLRVVKSPLEVKVIKDAIAITEAAFRRTLKFVKPGVKEYEVEAELIHEFVRRGAQGHAFSPIIGSGANSCVLHYVSNDHICTDGSVLLMDFGARHANYHADLTRTIPVNGRFTKRQRAVYDAVLHVQKAAKKLLKPGVLLKKYQKQVGEIMQEQLLKLKLLTRQEIADAKAKDPEKPAYKKYFMHGTSHHLGLDVHDVGDLTKKVVPGMVLTVEPGIYIPDEKLGIRLENDVLITRTGCIDLMKDIPIEAEEIEELMHQ